jgi:hypothetical protein
MANQKGQILTGARARLSINGVRVGYATNVTVSESIEYEEITEIDNIEINEFAPIGYRVTLTASMFRIVGETLKSHGWFPTNGADSAEHLENILINGDLTATVEDSKTGKSFATLENLKIREHSWSIDARGLVGENSTFLCKKVADESEV